MQAQVGRRTDQGKAYSLSCPLLFVGSVVGLAGRSQNMSRNTCVWLRAKELDRAEGVQHLEDAQD